MFSRLSLAPFAWMLEVKELEGIKDRLSPQGGCEIAKAGMVLGVASTALLMSARSSGLLAFFTETFA